MKLNFLGDVYLDKKYFIDFNMDRCIFNFEYVITDSKTPAKSKVNLKSSKSYLSETFQDSIEAVSLANNHTLDFQEKGLEDTLTKLKNEKIPFFGVGTLANNYANPYIFKFNGKKIAIMGYNCPSTNPSKITKSTVASLDKESVIRSIIEVKIDVDYVILYLHWGIEEISIPKFSDTQLAHAFIDNGADLIVGHHPHVVQSYEIYKEKHIFYSIGNFIFPDLNVDANFDGEKYTTQYKKMQYKEHRQSIVVTLDEQLQTDFFTVELDTNSNVISKKNFIVKRWIPKSESQFMKKLNKLRKINMLKRFLRDPKLPNMRHFKRFFYWKKYE